MPLQATSGAASYDAFGGGATAVIPYIEDVFSTYLYTGNSSTQTINNGIDLSAKGGLVWRQGRSAATGGMLIDTSRGIGSYLISYSTDAAQTGSNWIDSFNSNGFTMNSSSFNGGATYASWTFRKQPKFFDVVTAARVPGQANGRISHNLGSVPGFVIVKSTDYVGESWRCYHRSLGRNSTIQLSSTAAEFPFTDYWGTSDPTSTDFGINWTLFSGDNYVFYFFAHDAGGFGLTGTDNVISCGSFTTNGTGNATVSLGYEPQWVLVKNTSASEDWILVDDMRGWVVGGNSRYLRPNLSNAESGTALGSPTATGFDFVFSASATYIYIAIRRGPMKVPTVGTSVYQANTYTGNATANTTVAGNFGFPVDLMLLSNRDATATSWSSYGQMAFDRLRGSSNLLATASTSAASFDWTTYNSFAVQNSIGWGLYGADSGTGYLNNSGGTWVANGFRRAPSFFDEVCYTGTGVARTVTHNLTVAPELMITKNRTSAGYGWLTYSATLGATKFVQLNSTAAEGTVATYWNNTAPTSSVFSVGTAGATNASADNFVAYLFATCAGVSKVGSYTGTGTTLQIDCGFTAGARFVLIKRTDSTGDWYVWDSARGIIAGNDPYLLLNSSAAEVTNTDYVDSYSAGFELSSTAPAAINANGGTYIFLAIA